MSILIISNNANKALKYVKQEIEKEEGKRVNIFNNIDILVFNNNHSNLSTDVIRDINIKIQDKNINLSNKYLIISNFNRATPEAQNAFLKTLEESNKKIFLISTNKNGILETVISRVFIKYIHDKKTYNKKVQEILNKIVFNTELNLIKELCSKYSTEKILDNLEFFLNKHKEKFIKQKLAISINKIYVYKKRNTTIKLNTEIQITNIIIGLI